MQRYTWTPRFCARRRPSDGTTATPTSKETRMETKQNVGKSPRKPKTPHYLSGIPNSGPNGSKSETLPSQRQKQSGSMTSSPKTRSNGRRKDPASSGMISVLLPTEFVRSMVDWSIAGPENMGTSASLRYEETSGQLSVRGLMVPERIFRCFQAAWLRTLPEILSNFSEDSTDRAKSRTKSRSTSTSTQKAIDVQSIRRAIAPIMPRKPSRRK